MIRVYITAKVIHAPMLTEVRPKYDGIYFTAKWPTVANIPSENIRPVTYWLNDNFDDITRSDFVIVYADKHDRLKTSLVEIGWAFAQGKKVICCGENEQFEPWSAMCVARVKTLDEAIKRIKQIASPSEAPYKDYYKVGELICKTNSKLVAFATAEAGDWKDAPIPVGVSNLHALKFSDGLIFDAVNGWRKQII